jgi:hypothetical protein
MKDADENARFGLRFAAVVVVLATAPSLALAYIDPGNGAYMVQALFTLVGAAIFYLRHPVRSLKAAWHWALQRFKEPAQARTIGIAAQAMNHDADGKEPAPAGISEHAE